MPQVRRITRHQRAKPTGELTERVREFNDADDAAAALAERLATDGRIDVTRGVATGLGLGEQIVSNVLISPDVALGHASAELIVSLLRQHPAYIEGRPFDVAVEVRRDADPPT